MNRSKKIFAGFAIIFLVLLIYVAYDISSRTTFPGPSPDTIETRQQAPDTVLSDTLQP